MLLDVASLAASIAYTVGLINFQLGRGNDGPRMHRGSNHRISCNTIERSANDPGGSVKLEDSAPAETFAVTFREEKSARATFQNAKGKLPAQGRAVLFGQS